MATRTVSVRNLTENYQIPEFVQLACSFKSSISVHNSNCEFNAKSIMGMMSLDPTEGPLVINAAGDDEQTAVDELYAFLTR